MDTKAAFEKWCGENGYPIELYKWGFWKGQYRFESVRYRWEGWQASRAAIEIELPRGTDDEIGGYDIDLHATEKAITSQGLNIKK